MTTWATFAPCFLWIFLGAPYIERLRGNRALTTTLSAVTAAVVGVILNLAVTLAIQTLFDRVRVVQVLGGPSPCPCGRRWTCSPPRGRGELRGPWRFRVNVLWVVGAAAVAGVVRVVL